jgi:MFS superfamily sulfate permease-like transporter
MLPHVTELSLHPDGSFRDAHRHGLALCQGIVAVRLDGPLNFATLRQFRDELRGILRRRPHARQVLLAGHTLAGLDPIAAEELSTLFEKLHEEGVEVAVSGLNDDVRALLHGMDAIYPTQIKAVEAIHERAHQGIDEKACPLQEVVPATNS